jgi:microcystin-dependent protein
MYYDKQGKYFLTLKTKPYYILMETILPLGTIIAFAGQINPQTYLCGADNFSPSPSNNTGWILCDGSEVSETVFPMLFNAIGNLYGGFNGSFYVPDYRGYFLRGLAVNAGQDPGFANRIRLPNGENAGVGSTQQGMIQQHEHLYNNYPVQQASGGQYFGVASISHQEISSTTELLSNGYNLSGEETRPKNIYVNYLIYSGIGQM